MKQKSNIIFHLNLLLAILIFVVSFVSIVQANRAATQGYRLRDLETSIASLKINNQQLEIKVAELQSVESVSQRLKMLGLVPTETTYYVSSVTPTVAVR